MLMAGLIFATWHFQHPLDNSTNNRRMFTLEEQTVITDVVIKDLRFTNHLSYHQGQWWVNNIYRLDPNMRDVFFSVLSRMEIRTKVSASRQDSVKSLLKNHGQQVTIANGSDTVLQYMIAGDSILQQSYIMSMKKERAYQVHIPGYHSFVAGIFDVPEKEWRSRFVFSQTLPTLSSITIEDHQNQPLTITYHRPFFKVNGMTVDSTATMQVVEGLLYLQAENFLDTNKKQIINASTQVKDGRAICMADVSGKLEKIWILPKNKDEKHYLAVLPDSSLCQLNAKYIDNLFHKMDDLR